ncbi:MAG TPA: HlyD family efflux transporter periplasmic adaptor subunit [Polyangiaceae bacterium]
MKRAGQVKAALWAGVALVLALAVAWALRPQPVPAAVAVVTRGPLVATVSGEGRTRVKDLYVVAAPVDGQLERVRVQPGDAANADDVVATIRPAASRPLDARSRAEATAAAAAAKAGLARAQATEQEAGVALEHANSELETTRKLTPSGSVPAEQLTHKGHEAEIRRRALEAATAAVGQARAELARAQAVLGSATDPGATTPVRSPVTGRILRVLRESAGPIAAGTPLLHVGDVARLEIDDDLLSSDAAAVHPGAAATVTGWGGAQPLGARVRRVDPAAFTKVSALGLEEQRVHVVLDLDAPPPAGLGHDYRVDVAIVVWEGKDVLRVPSTALFRAGPQWAVFRVAEGRAHKTVVELGPANGTWTTVTNGLQENNEVITQPSDAIEDGTRIARRQ